MQPKGTPRRKPRADPAVREVTKKLLQTSSQERKDKTDQDVLAALVERQGEPATSAEVAARLSITLMAAFWSLRRLVDDGLAVSGFRSVEAPGRGSDVVAVFVANSHIGRAQGYPAWLCLTHLPQHYARRVVMGRAGMLRHKDTDPHYPEDDE